MTSSGKEATAPQSLVTEFHVKEALKSDKGSDAILKSWEVVDFTKPGDNYACIVTSVKVKFIKNKQDYDVTYVVKLNSLRNMEGFSEMTPMMFEKEGSFYQEILPALNNELVAAGQQPLRLPKCFHVCLEEGKEQMYFEDLRAKGFKMFDRRKGLDKNHSVLVMKELARLHSASYLMKSKLPKGETAATKYGHLSKNFFNYSDNAKEMFQPMFEKQIDTGVMMLENVGGYERAISWLNSLRPEVETLLTTYVKSPKFDVICHGDCWNNNILFRYDDEGHPIELMLVDLQVCQEVSVGYDLNYFLYSSVSGDVRKQNMDHFMSVYQSNYKEVVEGGNLPMFFDKEELMKEFREKHRLGALLSIGFVAVILTEPEEAIEFNDTDWDTVMKDWQAQALAKLKTNPLCKPRFLSVFDELMEAGLIP